MDVEPARATDAFVGCVLVARADTVWVVFAVRAARDAVPRVVALRTDAVGCAVALRAVTARLGAVALRPGAVDDAVADTARDAVRPVVLRGLMRCGTIGVFTSALVSDSASSATMTSVPMPALSSTNSSVISS